MIIFFLPCLFVVILGPAIMQIRATCTRSGAAFCAVGSSRVLTWLPHAPRGAPAHVHKIARAEKAVAEKKGPESIRAFCYSSIVMRLSKRWR